ncbi:hypothetical protein D3C81_1561270 [compost metagenome]
MVIHRPFHRILHRPYLIQQLLPAIGAPLMRIEKRQQRIFLGKQPDGQALRLYLVLDFIKAQMHNCTQIAAS